MGGPKLEPAVVTGGTLEPLYCTQIRGRQRCDAGLCWLGRRAPARLFEIS